MEYGEKIAALRKEHGMTQAELGAELNVTYQAVSKWERGESYPDFETMSRIAKLFGVPLSHFEENGENQDDTASDEQQNSPTTEHAITVPLGVCTACGKTVYENEVHATEPQLICNACHEHSVQQAKARAQAQKEKAERRMQAIRAERQQEVRAGKRKRNIGLIVAAVITLAWFIFALVVGIQEKDGGIIGGNAVFCLFLFAFVSQMIWGGIVRSVCCKGGVLIGTPGVIFSLDLDGIIFLIVVKILFAALRMLVYLVFLAFFVVVALIIAPFTFIPQCIRLSVGYDDAD